MAVAANAAARAARAVPLRTYGTIGEHGAKRARSASPMGRDEGGGSTAAPAAVLQPPPPLRSALLDGAGIMLRFMYAEHGRAARGKRGRSALPAPSYVDRHNALYDLLMFPLLHETGVGGYHYAKGGEGVVSTSGAPLTLQHYTRAMLFQNLRLQHMGRLAQEYALVQYSRVQEETLEFQRSGALQGVLRRRGEVLRRPGQEVKGSRVTMSASVPGSVR